MRARTRAPQEFSLFCCHKCHTFHCNSLFNSEIACFCNILLHNGVTDYSKSVGNQDFCNSLSTARGGFSALLQKQFFAWLCFSLVSNLRII